MAHMLALYIPINASVHNMYSFTIQKGIMDVKINIILTLKYHTAHFHCFNFLKFMLKP